MVCIRVADLSQIPPVQELAVAHLVVAGASITVSSVWKYVLLDHQPTRVGRLYEGFEERAYFCFTVTELAEHLFVPNGAHRPSIGDGPQVRLPVTVFHVDLVYTVPQVRKAADGSPPPAK